MMSHVPAYPFLNNHFSSLLRSTVPVILSLFFLLNLPAQSCPITGTIVDQNGHPLEFASVELVGTSVGALTDSAGHFTLCYFEVPSLDKWTVSVSMLGFKPERRVVNPQQLPLVLPITLQENGVALNEVVVSGTLKTTDKLDSPVPVEVYTDRFFKANPTPSIFESLQNVNGVRPQLNCNVCNTGDIHINGLEGPYTMVLIDGMPIVSGLATVYGLTGIPQSLIDRIEVVKGPAATLYGSEAVGGLINIITRDPERASTFSADLLSTSWGEYNLDLGSRFRVGTQVTSLLGINYFNFQNVIDTNDDGFTDLTLQNRISVFNKWNFRRDKGRVFTLAGRYVYEDRWGGQTNWSKQFRGGNEVYGESIYTSRWEAFGVYQLPVAAPINFQFSANGHQQNSAYGDVLYLADQYVGFGQMTYRKEVKKHDLLFGTALRYTYYDDNTPATAGLEAGQNQASEIILPGVFVQDQVTFSKQHKVLMGLRYDYNSLHGGIFSPRVNYQWTAPSRLATLRVSAGNGYRVANVFTEDHAALTGARDVVFAAELSPETSWNANVNFVRKFFTTNDVYFGLDASLFYTRFQNRILPDYDTNPNQIIYDNLDGFSVSRGASLNLEVFFPTGLRIVGGVTVMDVFYEDAGVREIPVLTESFSGVWSVNYAFRKIGLSIDYTGNIYGPMRLPLLGELDQRDEKSPWFSIQNIQLTKTIGKRLEIYGGIKNLLNYTPPANSIARAFDPFDRGVTFDANGQVVPTAENPQALTFDPTYVYASNQGIRGFFGIRYAVVR